MNVALLLFIGFVLGWVANAMLLVRKRYNFFMRMRTRYNYRPHENAPSWFMFAERLLG